MSDKDDSRWWEFYGVRYAQGTVVGAMIVFFLFSKNQALQKMLFIPEDPKDFGMAHLALLGIYGLAYCYISSAPILIMHAARGLLFESKINKNPSEGIWYRIFFVLVPSIIFSVAYFYLIKDSAFNSMAIFMFSMLTLFQAVSVYLIFVKSWKKTIEYYLEIIKKRNEHKDSGYIESYKHIREHGNSFLIVSFQIYLAFPIFAFVSQSDIQTDQSIMNLLVIIILWVLPAALIWFFGNKLENHLQEM